MLALPFALAHGMSQILLDGVRQAALSQSVGFQHRAQEGPHAVAGESGQQFPFPVRTGA